MSERPTDPEDSPHERARDLDPVELFKLGLGSSPGEAPPDFVVTTAGSAAASPAPAPELVAPHFPQLEILEVVGQGGMGVVYKARQKGLERLVALKLLPAALGEDPTFTERFAREARTLASLDHANIVRVHDFGQAGGHHYLILEFVDGTNLREALRYKTIGPTEALSIVMQICEALQFAHEEGVVHRDIKPENVLLDKRGRVKITDFGLAKLLGRNEGRVTLTSANQVMGTPMYMAPEQVDRPGEVDHRADIYSLGVVFYELLTGELPMGRFAPPSSTAGIDARLDPVVHKALENEPDKRYQHASDVQLDVEQIRKQPPREPQAAAGSPVHSGRRAEERGLSSGAKVFIALGLGCLVVPLVLIVLAGLWLFSAAEEPSPDYFPAEFGGQGSHFAIIDASSKIVFTTERMARLQEISRMPGLDPDDMLHLVDECVDLGTSIESAETLLVLLERPDIPEHVLVHLAESLDRVAFPSDQARVLERLIEYSAVLSERLPEHLDPELLNLMPLPESPEPELTEEY